MSRYLPATLLSLGALMLGWTGPAFGQNRALQQRLATATSLNCTFSVMATGRWQNGTPNATVTPAKIEVRFANVNADEGTADADSRFGVSFIVVRYANTYLHLMQMHGSGPLYTTTVLAQETSGGRLMAIHTRHEYTEVDLPGFTSKPEMYLGDCALGN
jgi:hypothetical protein